MPKQPPRFSRPIRVYDFFAGGGFVELGMPPPYFEVVYSNDFDVDKAESYRANFPGKSIDTTDLYRVSVQSLPGKADLVWASPPCTDLSLAGGRQGLSGSKSKAFFPFYNLMKTLCEHGRAPSMIIIENVAALCTSNNGEDLKTIIRLFAEIEYDALVTQLDARWFVPQTRNRTFVILWRRGMEMDLKEDKARLREDRPGVYKFIPRFSMTTEYGKSFSRISDDIPRDTWNDRNDTFAWFEDMVTCTAAGKDRIPRAVLTAEELITTSNHCHEFEKSPSKWALSYNRTRTIDDESRVMRELVFSGPAGCIRRASGGSSVPDVIYKASGAVAARVYGVTKLSPAHALRIMGLDAPALGQMSPYQYTLPDTTTKAYSIMGDAVVPQCVTFLMSEVVIPFFQRNSLIDE